MISNTLTPVSARKSIRKSLYLALVLFFSLGINACKKDTVDTGVYGAIAVVNASPTVATYDFYLSGTKINSVPIPSGGSMAYSQRNAGNHELKFSVAGRTESLLTKNVSVAANAYQTYYLVGKPGALDGFMVTDDRSQVSTTQAFVRFVNASPDALALDLFVKDGASLATNKAFKAYSGFIPVNVGTYTFVLKETANGNVKATTESVILGANGYYTIMANGLVVPAAGGIELPFSAVVMLNK